MKARARELHTEYLGAVDAGDWKKAWVAAQQAYALNPCWKIALNLGIAAVKTRRYVQGARLLSEALLTCRHDCPEPVREAGEQHLDEAKAHVGRVRVRTTIASPVILIDGKRLTEREAKGYFVKPGEHFVVVRGTEESREGAISVSAGELATIELDRATEVETDSEPSPVTNPPEERSGDGARTATLFTGIGLTTVAAGFSVGFLATAGARQSDINDVRSTLGEDLDTCVGNTGTGCSELQDLAARRDSATTRAQVSSIAAGVFGVATVGVLLFWPKASSSVALNVGPRTLSLSGTF